MEEPRSDQLGIPAERLNPLSGAVGTGHPIGTSGGITTSAVANAMAHNGHDYGVVGMSVGGGAVVMLLAR